MKALTFKQYKLIDLGLLSLIFVVGETVVTLAAGKWFPEQPWSLSLAIFFFCLGLMRWGASSWIFAVVGGFAYCIASLGFNEQGVDGKNFAVYCIGNLFMLFGILVFKIFGKEKVRTNIYITILYVACVYLFTEVGRFAVAFVFERKFSLLPGFVYTDMLSVVFALVLVIIIKKTDGLFEDQKTYLLRMEEEKEKEKNAEDEFANRI